MRFKEGFPSFLLLATLQRLHRYATRVHPSSTADSKHTVHGCIVITEQRTCADGHSSTVLPAIPTCGHQLNEWKFHKEVSFTGKYNVAWSAEWSNSCMHIDSTNSKVVFMAFHELKLK